MKHFPARTHSAIYGLLAVALTLSGCQDPVTGSGESTESALSAKVLHVVFDASYSPVPSNSADHSAVITKQGVELQFERPWTRSQPRYRLNEISAKTDRSARVGVVTGPQMDVVIDKCTIRPGTYEIRDPATGATIGALIVYPDCTTEILPSRPR